MERRKKRGEQDVCAICAMHAQISILKVNAKARNTPIHADFIITCRL